MPGDLLDHLAEPLFELVVRAAAALHRLADVRTLEVNDNHVVRRVLTEHLDPRQPECLVLLVMAVGHPSSEFVDELIAGRLSAWLDRQRERNGPHAHLLQPKKKGPRNCTLGPGTPRVYSRATNRARAIWLSAGK